MATFPRFTLIEMVEKPVGVFEGKIFMDVGNFSSHEIFGFRITFQPKKSLFVAYKNNKVFVSGAGDISDEDFDKYADEQKLVITGLKLVFQAYRRQLRVEDFARTRIAPGRYISIEMTTPDQLTIPLILACL